MISSTKDTSMTGMMLTPKSGVSSSLRGLYFSLIVAPRSLRLMQKGDFFGALLFNEVQDWTIRPCSTAGSTVIRTVLSSRWSSA